MGRQKWSSILLTLAATAVLSSSASATGIWVGGSNNNDWNTAANWDNNAVPTATSTTTENNGTINVNSGYTASFTKLQVGSATQTASQSITFNINAGANLVQGSTSSQATIFGYGGAGSVHVYQYGGTLNTRGASTTSVTYIGQNSAADYTISGGEMQVNTLSISTAGSLGTLNVDGGTVSTTAALNVSSGTSTGTINQTAGTVNVGTTIYVANGASATGVYNLSGGSLVLAKNASIGSKGTGSLIQKNATISMTNAAGTDGQFYVGQQSGSVGLYSIENGSLSASQLIIGCASATTGSGTLTIKDGANITLTGQLAFNSNAVLNAAAGSVIKMTGATGITYTGTTSYNVYFANNSTNTAALSALKNLTLVIAGGDLSGSQTAGTIEVGSQDFGKKLSGLDNNFALGTLQIGNGTTHGNAALIDMVANTTGIGSEVMYVDTLIVTSGSTLDLGGKTLYYVNDGGIAGSVVNGSLVQIPEPATMTLLMIGGGLAAMRNRRKA